MNRALAPSLLTDQAFVNAFHARVADARGQTATAQQIANTFPYSYIKVPDGPQFDVTKKGINSDMEFAKFTDDASKIETLKLILPLLAAQNMTISDLAKVEQTNREALMKA
jgi:hypothetical protein